MHFFFNSWRTKTVVEQTLTALFVLFVATKAEEGKAVFGLQLEVFIAFVLQVYLYAFIKFTTTAFIYTMGVDSIVRIRLLLYFKTLF